MSAIARGAGAAPGTHTPAGETRPLLELKDVHTHIGAYHILHGVDLTVPAGQVTMLLGRNGAGKTTTLRTIMGLWKASQGNLRFDGEAAGGPGVRVSPPDMARRGVAYVPENMGIFADLSVKENILLAARGAANASQLDTARLEWIFGFFPALRKFWLHPAGKLSGGQKQMLAVARAIIEPRRLLLIDEPSKGLAPAIVQNMIDAFIELKQAATTILLVEQNFTSRAMSATAWPSWTTAAWRTPAAWRSWPKTRRCRRACSAFPGKPPMSTLDADAPLPQVRADLRPVLLVLALAAIALPLVGSFSTWLTLTFAGLAMGMIIFIVASGMTLVFGLMDVLNFGHGLFIAIGAYLAATVLGAMGDWTQSGSLWMNLAAVLPAMIVGMLVAGAVGLAFERVIVRPVYGQHLKQILITMGGMIIGEELIKMIWGPQTISLPLPGAARRGAAGRCRHREVSHRGAGRRRRCWAACCGCSTAPSWAC